MKTVDQMIADILRIEGGYSDRAADRGGPTNHGVSLRYAKGIGLDLDGDGDTDKDDIRLVDGPTAARLFKEDFLIEPRIDRLPPPVVPQVFDCAVNHGPPRAIIFVQDVCIQAGFLPAVVNGRRQDDGVMGKRTRTAAERAQAEMGPFFNNAIMEERLRFYDAIVRNDPTQAENISGWRNRAHEFEMEIR